MGFDWTKIFEPAIALAKAVIEHLLDGKKPDPGIDRAKIEAIAIHTAQEAAKMAAYELREHIAQEELAPRMSELAAMIRADMKDVFVPKGTLEPLGVVTEMTPDEMGTFIHARELWRDANVCKFCGAKPEFDTGCREHGRGCYVVSQLGGGLDYPE